MNRPGRLLAFAASLAAFIAIAALLLRSASTPPVPEGPILVYCAAGVRKPVEAAVASYGSAVQLNFGGSNTLLAQAELVRKGDLFIAADESYVQMAKEKGLAAESIPLARQVPVLAVAKGNPKKVRTIDDLLRADVKLGQANPDAAAIGKLVRKAMEKKGRWQALKEKTLVFKPTVNEVANDLKLGTVDAGFVWDATVQQYPELERVDLAEIAGLKAEVVAVVLTCSAMPRSALRFARYLAARDRGQPEFRKDGYEGVDGDAWEEKPALLLYAGAMLRPAIEKTLVAFETREGCEVSRVYNGCGILVTQMKAGVQPDLYFACDSSFMEQVKDRFGAPTDVSLNQLVILVKKGNPHGIKTLQDLGKPGVKIGVGHEKQCALGALTQETLTQSKTKAEVMKNVVVQSPTGDLLVNQMRTGSLDAVVAYVSNAVAAADALEAIAIDIPCALAVQPLAVARDSKHRFLASRLMEALRTPESRRRFEAEGFRWKGAP
jgi:molybdenum ABC transporter molybdate-binding protein